jgi:hypothetical protein
VRGSVGLVIGLVVGSGAMYLALRPPWGHGGTTPPVDAGVVALAPVDAGAAKPKRKRPHHHQAGGTNPGGVTTGDEQGWGSADYVEETEPQLVQLTAADRAMEWRGDDTTRPTQKIDMGGGAESRSLDDNEIRSAIDSQSGPAQQCVIAAATNTNLSGQISVKLVVDGNGHVIKSKVQAFHYMFEHGLLACVHAAVGKMKFAATGASTLVTMPINFT